MFGNILIATALSFAVGLNTINVNYNHEENINNAIDFDNEGLLIEIGADELNNYTFENLGNYLMTYFNSHDYEIDWLSDLHIDTVYQGYSISLELDEFIPDDYWNLSAECEYDYYNLTLSGGYYHVILDLESEFNWVFNYNNDNPVIEVNNITFTNKITFDFADVGQSVYTSFKGAIELDIQANTPQQNGMGQSIIGAITSGLGLISDLAGQFLTGFTTLFYANGHLTSFGTFALVMLGVAITMAVVSLVLNIIRGNTGA